MSLRSSHWDNLFFMSTARTNPELPTQAGWTLLVFPRPSETKVVLTPENLTNDTFKANTEVMVIKLFLFTKAKAGLERKQVEHRFFSPSQKHTYATLWPADFLSAVQHFQSYSSPVVTCHNCTINQSSLTNSYRLHQSSLTADSTPSNFWHKSLLKKQFHHSGTTDSWDWENNLVTWGETLS